MPKVFDESGFRGQIYTDDHEPPHIHVFKAGAEIIVLLLGDQAPAIRRNKGMSLRDAKRALALVAEHQEEALRIWEEIHG